MTKAVFFDIDDTIYDYIGAHNNTMPVMKEWAYENLGIAKEDLEKYGKYFGKCICPDNKSKWILFKLF